jgi:hypothetical protein
MHIRTWKEKNEREKNMNLGLIFNLSLADWESEARVKHF